MTDLPETRADWLMTVIVRLIRPDIVSVLRQVEAQARAEALEEAARIAEDFSCGGRWTAEARIMARNIAAAIHEK